MLSEDFALNGTDRREWDDWYEQEVVHREQYKTLFVFYKGTYFQYQPIGYKEGEAINGRKIKPDSYIFFKFRINDSTHFKEALKNATCYDTLKDAIDNSKIENEKTLKDIWNDPESEYLDFS